MVLGVEGVNWDSPTVSANQLSAIIQITGENCADILTVNLL